LFATQKRQPIFTDWSQMTLRQDYVSQLQASLSAEFQNGFYQDNFDVPSGLADAS